MRDLARQASLGKKSSCLVILRNHANSDSDWARISTTQGSVIESLLWKASTDEPDNRPMQDVDFSHPDFPPNEHLMLFFLSFYLELENL